MIVFVVNCGSSSIKYQLINMEGERVMAKGLIERIGMEGSTLKHTPASFSASTAALYARSEVASSGAAM